MNKNRFPRLILASSVALALAACGGSDHDDAPAPAPAPNPPAMSAGDVFALTVSNKLISFNRDAPATIRTNVAVTGLQSAETLLGIDMRPADGQLYALGSSGRIYTIDMATGAATVKSTLAADATDTTLSYTALSGTDFGVDFNPAADRLRVVSNTGQSLRINVDSGATTTDGAINGGAANTAITASAYTNSFAGTANTTLYALDTVTDTLYVQNPPNNGTLGTPVSLGVDAGAVNGMDIDARNNTAYAVLTVGGARNLYSINLAAPANLATSVGALGINEDIRGIALRAVQAPVAYGLTDDGRLLRFKPATANTIDATVTISGLAAGETLLGIDFRPKDGLLYGMSSNARVVTIDPASGAATVKTTLAADVGDTTAPYAGIVGTAFVVDFNPVADRLRVIGDTGQNLRINVDTGATTTDGAINRAGAAPSVSAGAYTNSFAATTATMLYDIERTGSSLAIQNPPNDGTLAPVGPLGVTVAGSAAMDIAGGANGLVLAALRSSASGPSSLYRVDLATGAATLFNGSAAPGTSAIGNGQVGLRDIALLIAP